MENVVIIGSGCAGWTAAIYTARANLNPLVLTGWQAGGLLTTTTVVENFPGFAEGVDGTQLMVTMQRQAERFGARVSFQATVEKAELIGGPPFRLIHSTGIVETRTVIIAVGASHKHLGVPGEKELEGKGVTYCATCDGALPVFRNKPLVVVGGGDSACEEALFLTRFASEVFLVHRRDQLRASRIMAERALAHSKIRPVWNSVIEEIHDPAGDSVSAVSLRDVKTNLRTLLPCAGVFVAVGHVPNTAIFAGQVDLDPAGYVRIANSGTRTNIPGVFAAGDCADSTYRQAITAAAMGCMAAIDAERFLAAGH